MSLLEAAKNLRDVARTLDNPKFNFNVTKVKELCAVVTEEEEP